VEFQTVKLKLEKKILDSSHIQAFLEISL